MADFLATYRDLDISAAITLRSGKQITVGADDIYSYNINGTAATTGIPIGEAIAQTFSIGVSVAACPYTAEELDSAEVRVRIGVRNSNSTGYSYKDAGAWYVTSVGAPEGASALTLKGTDALGLWFGSVLEDSEATYPASLRGLLEKVSGAASVSVSSRRWLHDDAAINVMPEWNDNTTLRDVVGYIAACAGGFAQINMSGELEIITNGQGDVVTLDTAAYNTYTPTGGARFKLNCLRVTYPLTEDETEPKPIRFAVNAKVEDNATNCAEVVYNPLITDAMASAIVKELAKSEFAGGDVVWLGDPSVICGHVVKLTPIDGVQRTMLVNSFSLAFDGGLSGQLYSAMPTLRENSTHYSSSGSVFNPDGSLPVSKINGLSGGVVNAMLGKFDRIVAGEISTDRFFAQMGAVVLLEVQNFEADTVDATILRAGSVTASKLAADSVTADKIKAGAITANKIAAKTITADSGIIDNGAIGTAQIADGSITSAKIVSLDADVIKTGTLSAERIVLVGDDGIIYKLNATSSGLSLSELSKEQYKNYINGTVIVAKSITAAQIAAETITANEILAGTITTKQINVTELFANEATINALNAVDITGNGSLRLLVNNIPTLKIHEGQLAQDTSLEDQGIRVYSDYVITQDSGTPSPTNIMPISGKSAVNMTRCGRNLFGGEEITVSGYQDFTLPVTLPPGTYTVSASIESTDTDSDIALFGFYKAESKVYTYARFKHDGTAQTFTLTFTEPISLIRMNASDNVAHGTGDTAVWRNVQVEYGDTKHDFEPYKADEFNVDFGGIRSGRFDWAAGILTEEGRCLNIDGTENWKQVSSGSTAYWYLTLGVVNYAVTINATKKCSHFGIADIRSSTTAAGYNIGNSTSANECRLSLRPGVSNVTDVASLKAYLAAQAAAGTPVQVAYQLTVPETVQFNACPVWAVEGFNTVIADGSSGRIEFGHDSLTQYLQSQIDMIPGQIKLSVVAGVDTGSGVTITKDEVNINSPKTTISIPAADSADAEEIVSVDDNGLYATMLTADEIRSDSIVRTAAREDYTPANSGELRAKLDDLAGRYMTGDINIDASAVEGGSFVIKGLGGHGVLLVTGGKINELKVQNCTVMVRLNNTTFESSGTAVTAYNSKVYLSSNMITADEGVYAYYDSQVIMNNCKGNCETVLRASSGSVVTVNGATCPTGKLGSITAAEVYSTVEFTETTETPTVSEVTTITIDASATRTWGGGWLSTSTFGTALYQGATGDGDLRMGCMWFDTAAISGKEIISATLTLRRVSGIGGGGSVKVRIFGTTTASASGTPARGKEYTSISLANGATGSVDITEAVTALASGSIKGLMIYDDNRNKFNGKTYTYGYAKIFGTGGSVPTLTVTFK